MTMRRAFPILAIVLFAATASNRGATARDAASRPDAVRPQASAVVQQAAAPADAPPMAPAYGAAGLQTEAPRSVVVTAPSASNGRLASTVLDSGLFPDPKVRDAYDKARLVADRLDKMYCYCECHEDMGHRSLLSCFQGTHAAQCGICMREAHQAWVDWQAGRSVEQTQKTVDAVYHQGAPPPSLPSTD